MLSPHIIINLSDDSFSFIMFGPLPGMSCATSKSVVSRWQAPDERATRPYSYVSPTLSGHAIC